MIKRGVWKYIDKGEIPHGRRHVGNMWVFKIKRNGIYRARLCALGYSQIPGVDFSDNFAPVIHDVTFRIVLTRKLVENLSSKTLDIETAFLYGELDEEIYMEIPKGFEEVYPSEETQGMCCFLNKAMYGLVQAARQFWKRFVKELVGQGFQASVADPCLLYRKDEKGICIVVMYVDDMLLVGNEESIQNVSEELEKVFNITVEEEMTDYLGCEFKTDEEGKNAWLGQPNMVHSIRDPLRSHF